MKTQYDDKKLIEGCLNHDRNSQKLLYEKYAPAMLGLCMRYTYNKDEAEDIMIEGFMNVFSRLESFRAESSLETWIKRVMINCAITYYRKNMKYMRNISLDEYAGFEIQDMNVMLETSYSQKELLNMIQEMPEHLRIVLNLRAFEGYEYCDIANELDISEITARTRFSKAKKWLEDRLKLNPKK